jgi:hypothetical protein
MAVLQIFFGITSGHLSLWLRFGRRLLLKVFVLTSVRLFQCLQKKRWKTLSKQLIEIPCIDKLLGCHGWIEGLVGEGGKLTNTEHIFQWMDT